MSELGNPNKIDKDLTIKGLQAELTALRTRLQELEAQQRQDALDGQAAMDEANNEIIRLRKKLDEVGEMFISEVLPILQGLEQREYRRNRKDEAEMIDEISIRFQSVLDGEKGGKRENETI